MSVSATEATTKPNLKFSHIGLHVGDLDRMQAFYTRALGFTVTDVGEDEGPGGKVKLVFLSRDPNDHHQIVLVRLASQPPAGDPRAVPTINQISFQLSSLDDLRDVHKRLQAEGASGIAPANHGIAWSIYANDPENNRLEFFVDTEWYIKQPFKIPLDLSKSNEELTSITKAMCEVSEGYEPYNNWRTRIAAQMTRYVPAKDIVGSL